MSASPEDAAVAADREVRLAEIAAEVRKAEIPLRLAEIAAEERKAELRLAEISLRVAEIAAEERKAVRAEAKAKKAAESYLAGGEFLYSPQGPKTIPGHSSHPNSSHHYCPLDHHTQPYFLLLRGGFWYRVSRVDPLSLGRAIPHHSQVVRSVPSHRLHVRVPQSSWQTLPLQVSNSEHARLR